MANSPKTCINGHEVTPDSYYIYKGRNLGCRQCNKNRRDLPENKAKFNTPHMVAWRVADKWRKNYGITVVCFLNLLQLQDFKCQICKRSFDLDRSGVKNKMRPHVDHDHASKEVRGLLCGDCNVGIGMFKDSLYLLNKVENYLTPVKTAQFA